MKNEQDIYTSPREEQLSHFYTYLPQDPPPVAGPIQVYWASGSSGKKCGVLNVIIGHQIDDDVRSRGALAELAAFYHYWCDQPGGVRERDGRLLVFHATHAALLKKLLAGVDEPGITPVIRAASRMLAIRFMDAFVRDDSKEFFETLMEKKPLNNWNVENYKWYRMQVPTVHIHGLGKVTMTYAPVTKWAHDTKSGSYRRGAWKCLRQIAKDPNNIMVFNDYDEVGTEYWSVFSPLTGTLFHCLRNRGEEEVFLFDLQSFPADEREPGEIVTVHRVYGAFDLDISPRPDLKQNTADLRV